MVCDGWVVLMISEERKTSMWIQGVVPSGCITSTRGLDRAYGVDMTAGVAQVADGRR